MLAATLSRVIRPVAAKNVAFRGGAFTGRAVSAAAPAHANNKFKSRSMVAAAAASANPVAVFDTSMGSFEVRVRGWVGGALQATHRECCVSAVPPIQYTTLAFLFAN